jgi:hypothetical protein
MYVHLPLPDVLISVVINMPGPRPPIPQRHSSLDPKPQTQKKRISLSNMPILSKLGLGKTSSSQPTSPTDKTTPALPPIQPPRLSPLSQGSTPMFEIELKKEELHNEPETLDASTGDLHETSSETATHKGRNGSLHLNIPSVPPPALKTPPRLPQSPIESIRSATAELGVLREVDENEDIKGRLSRVKSDPPVKPSSCPKSIWLCSKPPTSPPTSPTDLFNARRRSGSRPLVVRAMSTGRLASEFDDEGRVICLSNHCERVLKARASMSPAPSPIRTGNHLTGSMSNQDQAQTRRQVIRAKTSDLFPMMSPDKQVRKQASWKRADVSRTWKELST